MATPDFASLLADANFSPPDILAGNASQQEAPSQAAATQRDYSVDDLNYPTNGTPTGKNPDFLASRIYPEDMTEKTSQQNREFSEAAGYKEELPAYIFPPDKSETAQRIIVTNSEGKPAILMNPAAVEYTPSYVEQQIMPSDRKIELRIKSGELKPVGPGDLPDNVYNDLPKISEKMGNTGKDAPTFVINSDDSKNPDGAAYTTREGKNIIEINPSAVNALKTGALTAETFEANIAHEESHIKLKQESAKNLADEHNIPGKIKQDEHDADVLAAGPQGATTPEALSRSLEAYRDIALKNFREENPKGTMADFEKSYADPNHPSYSERQKYLNDMIKPQKPEASPTPPSTDPMKLAPPAVPNASPPAQTQSVTR